MGMTDKEYLHEIIGMAQALLCEEGSHEYNLFVDQSELDRAYDALDTMLTNIRDEQRKSA